jgi:CheY-like chemotaxis protein
MKKTILLVEDTEVLQADFIKRMASLNLDIRVASNGQVALMMLKAQPEIELVVLDYSMPVMDGLRFLHERHLDPDLMKIPVVMCTSYPEAYPEFDVIRDRQWALGFLPKQCRPQELMAYLG